MSLMTDLRQAPSNAPARQMQRGVSMIEALVSLVVLAFGVLGLLGVQLRTMVNSQNANHMATAARLADSLFERVKVNPNADPARNNFNVNDPLNVAQWGWLANYYNAWGNLPAAAVDCGAGYCTTANKAAWDLRQWKLSVQQSLPSGEATVLASDNARQLIVIIGWRANEQSGIASPAAFDIPNVAEPAACGTTHVCYFAYGQP